MTDQAAPVTASRISRFFNVLASMPAMVLIAAVFMALMLGVAFFAELLAPRHYTTQDLSARLRSPVFVDGTWQFMLGTDELGRDVLSRLIYALRFSLLVAVAGTIIGCVLGTFLGFLAAHFRGWVDEVLMMLVDVQAALPFMLLALCVLAFFGNSFVLFVMLIGIHGWEQYARLVRGMVMSAQTHGYAVAVKSVGATPARVYARHILPNIASAIIVSFTLNFPVTILLEASLSFLGLGVQPPLTSLGQMLGAGRAHLLSAWWIAVFPGAIIFLMTLSVSILGDWLRDRLDPTLQRR
ncbi:MAG: ABC transporter permease [Beijerinckiaceae bacterium]